MALRFVHQEESEFMSEICSFLQISNESESLADASIRTILFELRLRFEPMSPEMELLKTLIAIIS